MKPHTKLILISLAAVIVFLLVISLAIYLLNQNPEPPSSNRIDVIEVIDGDTFKTTDGETVRLICIDTPEPGEEGYEDAISFLQSRILNADEIRLEGNSSDRYGRNLRWVYVDDVLLNKEIVDYDYGTIFEYEDENCSLMFD